MWWLLAFVWRFLRWKGDRRCVKSQKIRQVAFAARKFFGGEWRNFYFMIFSYVSAFVWHRWWVNVSPGSRLYTVSFPLMMVVWLGGVAVWLFQLMTFGFFLCVDAFLYVFTLLPLRVLLAVLRLLTLPCCGFRSEPEHVPSYLKTYKINHIVIPAYQKKHIDLT